MAGQEFRAAVVVLALPMLPGPGLCSAGSWSSPRRLGHCPLFQRIKLVLLLSLSLFQQFLPPLHSAAGNIPAWGLPSKTCTREMEMDGGWQHHGGFPGMGISLCL